MLRLDAIDVFKTKRISGMLCDYSGSEELWDHICTAGARGQNKTKSKIGRATPPDIFYFTMYITLVLHEFSQWICQSQNSSGIMVPIPPAGGGSEGLSCDTAVWWFKLGIHFWHLSWISKDTETSVNMVFGQFHAVSIVLSLRNVMS